MADLSRKTFADTEGTYNFDNLRNYSGQELCLIATESLQQVKNLVQRSNIIHLHGMSGSGKSKIIAGICADLCSQNRSQSIWRVECQSSGGTIRDEWKKFAQKLRENELISRKEYETTRNALLPGSQDDLEKFVDSLNKIGIPNFPPIVFVIEDICDDDEKDLVKNLIACMQNFYQEIVNLKLLIATQDANALFSEALRGGISYQTYEVKGFTPMEALDFLGYAGLVISDQDKVDRLARELAYSPLGLLMVKSYCMEHRISYEEYWDTLESGVHTEKEKELLKKYPNLGKYHRYEVIMRLFRPRKNDTEEKYDYFKVLKMMSFVSHQKIPVPLLERFFREAKSGGKIKQFAVKYFITKLRQDVGASTEEEESLLTLHADILRAINISMDPAEKRKVLQSVIFAMGAMLDKDNRDKPNYVMLHSLKQHAERVARCSAEYFAELKEDVGVEDIEILLGLSKLNEVVGFAISQQPGFREKWEEDNFYEKAMDCIWVVACAKIGDKSCSLCWLPGWLLSKRKKEEREKELIYYNENKDPQKTAQDIFKKLKDASVAKSSVKEVLRNDWERMYHVKQRDIDGMQAHMSMDQTRQHEAVGTGKVDYWQGMKDEISKAGGLSKQHMEILLQHGLIVPWEKLVKYYLAERLASILHSRGRLDNYKGDVIPTEMHASCEWYSQLGRHLCDVAADKTGVKSIFYYILRANNQIPRDIRKCKAEDNNAEFQELINKSLESARAVKEEKADYFEHGIYKQVSGTPFTLMNALKYIVKAHTKLQKRPKVAKTIPDEESAKADEECAELCKICLDNSKIVIAGTCLVHAGKYLAATGKYDKALETFKSAFECGISERKEQNTTTYCWALYNMGRAIVSGDSVQSLYVEKFNDRCEMVRKMDIPEKWRNHLDDMKDKVDGH